MPAILHRGSDGMPAIVLHCCEGFSLNTSPSHSDQTPPSKPLGNYKDYNIDLEQDGPEAVLRMADSEKSNLATPNCTRTRRALLADTTILHPRCSRHTVGFRQLRTIGLLGGVINLRP